MSRTLAAGHQSLIDSGHCEDHTCLTITLGNGTVLRFATALLVISGNTFLANLGESDPLNMSLTAAMDRAGFKAQNVDKALGQTLLGISNALEGATAMLGTAFQDNAHAGPIYYDDKMPGDIFAGAIDEQWVVLNFVNEIDAGQVVGDTVSSVFPYQNLPMVAVGPTADPDDIPDPDIPRRGLGGGYRAGRLPQTEVL